MRKLALAFSLSLLLVAVCIAAASQSYARHIQEAHSGSARFAITPVEGPSWLRNLGLHVFQTSLEQMGDGGFIPSTHRTEPRTGNTFVLAGADLYRINCRGCHGPEGKGAPPEINSLIGPVQGMSPAFIRQRMKARGLEADDAMVNQLATQAEGAIRQRLQKGGKKMPPFEYLDRDEVNALLAYLETLAAVPAPRLPQRLVHEAALHVGEDVVKSTCHVCHDATGPGRGGMMMMRGTIPSLASIPYEQPLSSVMRQVQYGSPPMMGMMGGGERMPALPYFTEEEIAAAYFYLANYPPAVGREGR
jgi:mono/diheme cytochrome c family protein